MEFRDLFSKQASDYARYRPRYPAEVFRYLASLCIEKDLVWDCATGNGQAAVPLAEHFTAVVATDASRAQLASAEPHERVSYRQARSHESGIPNRSVDLVTVFQALHWFARDPFYNEVRRVTKPGGLLAAVCYALHRISPEVDKVVDHYYNEVVGKYWSPERDMVDSLYATLPFPFPKLEVPAFSMEREWALEDLVGYLFTWSATQKAIADLGRNPLEELAPELEAAWGDPAHKKKAVWPLTVLVGEVHERG